jgi:putative SOS response-associated peptidase YedK
MCYSAQVVQIARKLNRTLGVRIDSTASEALFLRRLDEPRIAISRGFEANFEAPVNDVERRIKAAIDAHRARAATQVERDLFVQKTRLVNAERLLRDKETKKAREDVRIATNKIEALGAKLTDLRRSDSKPEDDRIFPMVYAGVIVRADGDNVLTPMRYFCRPAGKPAAYDRKFPGLYNARRDNLEKFWAEQFGSHHAIAVVESFYENVAFHTPERRPLNPGEAPRNVVLQFTPEPPQTMLVACLWSRWTGSRAPGADGAGSMEPSICGFAAITDEPPPEVAAAGHDRCIVNLRPENVEAWLTPAGRSTQELQSLLQDRAAPLYQHRSLRAA